VRLMVGGNAPSWLIVFAPLAEALLWPLATIVLLMPQRRAPDPDVDRPL
jgi:rod shape-determining protein MreD